MCGKWEIRKGFKESDTHGVCRRDAVQGERRPRYSEEDRSADILDWRVLREER